MAALSIGQYGIGIPTGIEREFPAFGDPDPGLDPDSSKVGKSRSRILKFHSRPGSRPFRK